MKCLTKDPKKHEAMHLGFKENESKLNEVVQNFIFKIKAFIQS